MAEETTVTNFESQKAFKSILSSKVTRLTSKFNLNVNQSLTIICKIPSLTLVIISGLHCAFYRFIYFKNKYFRFIYFKNFQNACSPLTLPIHSGIVTYEILNLL